MSKSIEEKLEKIPVINLLVKLFKSIRPKFLEGLSLYDLLELYIIGIVKGALTTRASAIAYSFFMALFPFLLFVIIIIPYIPIEGFQGEFLAFLDSFLPPTTTDFFHESIFDNIQGGGLISTVFLLSILLMANGVSAVFTGFETSYHEQEVRNVFKQYIFALGIALILAFLLIVTVAVLGYFNIYVVENIVELAHVESEKSSTMLVLSQYLFFVIMVYVATATLYYFGTKEGKHLKFFSIGAFVTTLLIILTSYLFGIYIENFGQYDKLYGSIGALLILMFYFWLNANILLLGFELNVSLSTLRKKKSL
ncbi:MAG: YihY/virulence factor BrkB family protein [Psychroserpens sp.]|nr:YihY/virulence factor BrkB family protein [Psychroserpens sp.]